MVTEEDLRPLITSYAEEKQGTKVDLGCGANLRQGYKGVDYASKDVLLGGGLSPGLTEEDYSDYEQVDLLTFPWPFEDNSLAATFSSHFVEHIPHQIPGTDWRVDGWWHFFAELYRVLEDGGIAEFVHPFSRSDRAFWDPTHTRFIHYQTWFYLQKDQRLRLGVDHYAPEVDFNVKEIQTIHEPDELRGKSEATVGYAREFYWNVTDDLFVVLECVK